MLEKIHEARLILSDYFLYKGEINEYLVWAVRTVRSPVSTIEYTLKADEKLYSEVIEGKNLRQSDLYISFFSAVRGNKEHDDNLGEELIAICVHILSYMVGIKDGKLSVLTDDKGAAGKIDSVMRRTNPNNKGGELQPQFRKGSGDLCRTERSAQRVYFHH